MNPETLGPQRQLGNRAQNADVAQQPALLGRIVIEQADDAPFAAVRELLGEMCASFARAQNQHRLAQRRQGAV